MPNYRRESSVSEMMDELGWVELKHRRRDARLKLFFKIVNGLSAVQTSDILVPNTSKTRKSNPLNFKHIRTNTEIYKHSFFPRTIPQWNTAPSDAVSASSADLFLSRMKTNTMEIYVHANTI